jgi:hypothetical protein
MTSPQRLVLLVALVAIPGGSARAEPERVLSAERLADIAVVRGVTVRDGELSGVVVNRSGDTLRDVRLRIEHFWLWTDELHPGTDDPSSVEYHTVAEVPPHGSVPFTVRTQAGAAARTDGHFEARVDIDGLATVAEAPAVPGTAAPPR